MSSETFNDPPAGSTERVFLDALRQYIQDGHPISTDGSGESETPTVSFVLQREIFEGYLRGVGIDPEGYD